MAGRILDGIYARVEARLIELEKRTGELERKLKALEELAKLVAEQERQLKKLAARHV